jgi:hypothetical protein
MRTDGDWLSMKVKQEPVLFVTSDDDRKDVNLNLRSILKAESKSLAHNVMRGDFHRSEGVTYCEQAVGRDMLSG